MAEAKLSKSRSIGETSDVLPDIHCNLCFEVDGDVLEADGYCQDCDSFLCAVCFASHRKVKQTRSHQLLDKYNMPQVIPNVMPQHFNTENCFHHQSENINSYCKSCDQLCCKICLTVDHHHCTIENLSTIAFKVKHSQELKDLNQKLDVLKTGYKDNHDKANKHMEDIEKYYADALHDMRKMQEEVTRLLAETEKQAELIKSVDLQTMETIITTCEIIGDQIDNIKLNLNKKESHNDSEVVFIAMKRADSQLRSFEDRLEKLKTDNTIHTIHQYKFEPDKSFQTLLNTLEALGKLSFSKDKAKTDQMLTTPLHVEDVDIQSSEIRCSILLPNQQILITDFSDDTLVKLMDMKQNKVVAEHELPGYAWDIAKVKQEMFAATCSRAQKIQFIEVTSKLISKIREIAVIGECYGIAYNDQDKTLIVTYDDPGKVEILSLTGSVIRVIKKDKNGAQLFTSPYYVALSRDKTMIYVSDDDQHSVTM